MLAGRRGKGAATDRLGLLLMVLNTRASGWLQLCGGSVKVREGRGAATLSRLLGCSPSGARKVLARLAQAGVVARQRKTTATRMRGRGRVMLLPVARAYGRTASLEAVQGPRAVFSQRPGGAGGDHGPSDAAGALGTSGIGGAEGPGDAADQERPDGAELHADHAPVVTPVVPPQLSCGFSGGSRGGEGRRPEHVRVREDQAVNGEDAAAKSASRVAEGGPLRGEKPKKSPVDERDGQRVAGAGAGGRPKAVGWDKAQQQRRVGLPARPALQVALGPVAGLWERLSGWQQDQVQAAAEAEIKRLEGLLEHQGGGPRLLADRLVDRLAETGGEALVVQPFPWLIRRGLVQRPACSDLRCDDGTRLDTRSECPSCVTAIADRRALRARVRAAVTAEQGQRPVSRAAYEERLREHSALETDRARARHARAAVEVERRRAAVAGRRQREQEAEQARLSAPCADCGLADAAGLCPRCSWTRRTEVLVAEAVDLAVAARSVLDDPEEVAGLSEACGARVRELVTEGCRRQVGDDVDEVIAAFTSVQVAERVRDEEQADALRRLAAGPEAEAEAAAVLAAELRRSPRQLEAARAAGKAARHRAAEYLLRHRLGRLRVLRARAEAGRPLRRVS